jgi:MoxR-like ATPase
VLARQVTAFIQELRLIELYKVPGVAETLDWIAALLALDQQALDPQVVDDTLGVILKYQDDVSSIKGKATERLVEKVGKLN